MGMSMAKNTHESERLALSVADVAELLDVSQRHVWKLNARGGLPAPVRLGRSVRWNRAELVAWLNAGCPARVEWESMKAAQ